MCQPCLIFFVSIRIGRDEVSFGKKFKLEPLFPLRKKQGFWKKGHEKRSSSYFQITIPRGVLSPISKCMNLRRYYSVTQISLLKKLESKSAKSIKLLNHAKTRKKSMMILKTYHQSDLRHLIGIIEK